MIDQKEMEIEELRELRFDPEYYHDYQKMAELDNKIDDVNNEIENLMLKWEECKKKKVLSFFYMRTDVRDTKTVQMFCFLPEHE